jgi:hypothetical protein
MNLIYLSGFMKWLQEYTAAELYRNDRADCKRQIKKASPRMNGEERLLNVSWQIDYFL